MLRQDPPGAGVAGHLRFFYAYGCCLANFRLVEQACLQWLEDEERVDAPNQKLEDLWPIPLPLERGELRVRKWNRYIRKYRRSLKLVEDWNEASEIRHLLKDVLPGRWKRRVEDEEKKRAKKRVAVRIMASEDTHAGETSASPAECWG